METKKTVILVVVYLAVLAACVVMTGVGKHHDVKTGVRIHLSTNEITTGENRVSAMPDDPEYGKFDCVLAEDDNNMIAALYAKGFIDPSQLEEIDPMLRLPKRKNE